MKERTDVLTVTEHYWPKGGGIELATHLIIELLSQNSGIQFKIVSGTKNPKNVNYADYLYSPYLKTGNKISLWINLLLLKKVKQFKDLLSSVDALYIPRYCYPLIPLAKKQGKKVIVHLHDYQPISYGAAVFPNSKRLNPVEKLKDEIRFEVVKHGVYRGFFGSILNFSTILIRNWIAKADKIICVSSRQAGIIKREAPELAEKIEVIYNPPPKLPKERGEKRRGVRTHFLYAGGDDPLKGIRQLATTVDSLGKTYNFRCTLAKIDDKKWKRYFHKMDQRYNATFEVYDKLPYEEFSKIMNHADALIIPSICAEPLPYVVVEAMLSGTLPIASKVGGIPEIVEGTHTEELLFEPGNTKDLLEKMKYMISLSKEKVEKFASEIRWKIRQKIDEKKIEKEFLKLFTQ